jgi:ABC-type sugar transport system ATPase subunit
LSGGQRQRVVVGRALVRDPEVFLFDEPLSNLGALLRVQMRIELDKLHKSLGATMIYVTHDQVEAMTLADKIVVLDNGRIAQTGSPLELYNSPANRFVASFIGSPAMNFFGAHARFGDGTTVNINIKGSRELQVFTRAGAETNGEACVEVGIRPAHVSLAPQDESEADLNGTVRIVEHLGNSTIIYADTDAGQVVAESHGKDPIRSGDRVVVKFDVRDIHLFEHFGHGDLGEGGQTWSCVLLRTQAANWHSQTPIKAAGLQISIRRIPMSLIMPLTLSLVRTLDTVSIVRPR